MKKLTLLLLVFLFVNCFSSFAQTEKSPVVSPKKLETLKQEILKTIDSRQQFTQQLNDQIFSYAELGFQEFKTSALLREILEKNGFAVERGIAGMPTAWMAKWGSGKPVIAIGSDLDCIPKASQKPGWLTKTP